MIVRTLLAALLLAGAGRAAGAQAIAPAEADEHPEAVGCWTVRADGTGRADGAGALGLPAQLRIDLRGDVLAVREGMTRRGSWTMSRDGALRVTVPLAAGGAAAFEVDRAEGEWIGFVRAVGGGPAGQARGSPRVTLVRGSGCPKG
jgi:hypothetical protein